MLNILFQTLSLSGLLIIMMVSWFFDQKLLSQVFYQTFPHHQVMIMSMVMAGIFCVGRVLCYAWLGQKQHLGFLHRCNYFSGAAVLISLSFFASITIVSTALNNPNVANLVVQEKKRTASDFRKLKNELTKREKSDKEAINDRFDGQINAAIAKFEPRKRPWKELIEDEEKRKFKSGPYKGSPVGEVYLMYKSKLDAIDKEAEAKSDALEAKRLQAHTDSAEMYRKDRISLLQTESDALANVTAAQFDDTRAASNKFFVATVRSANDVGLDLTYTVLIVLVSVLVALVIEILTFAFTNSYIVLRGSREIAS